MSDNRPSGAYDGTSDSVQDSRYRAVQASVVLRFFRPTIFVLLCFGCALIASLLLPRNDDRPNDVQRVDEITSAIDSLILPKPSLQPRDVVRIQLEALADPDQARGVLQCMTFASPGNRVVTGPLERFGQMVRSEKFKILGMADRVLIGNPVPILGDTRILVTLIDGKELRSFAWILSEQEIAPYRDCWMTDGVFSLEATEQDRIPRFPAEGEI